MLDVHVIYVLFKRVGTETIYNCIHSDTCSLSRDPNAATPSEVAFELKVSGIVFFFLPCLELEDVF